MEKEMATHSSILPWSVPWTDEPGGLPSTGSHRVGHDWSNLACMRALEKEMATHSSVLAWRVPGMGEPGGLSSMGSHRVGHDWSDSAAAASEKPNGPYLCHTLLIIQVPLFQNGHRVSPGTCQRCNLWAHTRSIEWETLGVRPTNLCLMASRCFWYYTGLFVFLRYRSHSLPEDSFPDFHMISGTNSASLFISVSKPVLLKGHSHPPCLS